MPYSKKSTAGLVRRFLSGGWVAASGFDRSDPRANSTASGALPCRTIARASDVVFRMAGWSTGWGWFVRPAATGSACFFEGSGTLMGDATSIPSAR